MNEIITELKRIKCMEMVTGTLNVVYFYIQAYGKDLRDDLKALAEALGQDCYLLFDKMEVVQGKSYIDSFDMLLEKNQPLGKAFTGCVLVDFTGMEPKEELADFVDYLSRCTGYSFVFTMKEAKEAEAVQRILKQHFFLRSVKASLYTEEEQFAVVIQEMNRYQEGNVELQMDKEQEAVIRERLKECSWKSEDQVLFLIKNAMAGAVYERMLTHGKTEIEVDDEFITQMFSELGTREERQERRYRVGFSVEGFEYA